MAAAYDAEMSGEEMRMEMEDEARDPVLDREINPVKATALIERLRGRLRVRRSIKYQDPLFGDQPPCMWSTLAGRY